MVKPFVKQPSSRVRRAAAPAARPQARPAKGGVFRLTYATMFDPPPPLHDQL